MFISMLNCTLPNISVTTEVSNKVLVHLAPDLTKMPATLRTHRIEMFWGERNRNTIGGADLYFMPSLLPLGHLFTILINFYSIFLNMYPSFIIHF